MTPLLLAEQYYFHLRNPFRESGWQGAIVLVGVILAVGLGLGLISRYVHGREKGINSPRRLFRALCAAHRLNFSERALLHRLAKHHQLASPAVLFVEARLWEEDTLGAAWQQDAAERRSLREKLFARN